MAEQSSQIQTNALSPLEVTTDGTTATQQAIPDQIKGDQYAAAAVGVKKRRRGCYFSKIINPGAMSDNGGSRTGSGFNGC